MGGVNVFAALRRRWWLILITTVIGTATAFSFTTSKEKVYDTSTSLLLTSVPGRVSDNGVVDPTFLQAVGSSYAEIANSPAFDDQLKAARGRPEKDLYPNVIVQLVPNTLVLRADVHDLSAAGAQRSAQAVGALLTQDAARLRTIAGVPRTAVNIRLDVASVPVLPQAPSAGSGTTLLLAGALGGFLIGAAGAIAVARVDDRVRTAGDLTEKLDTRVWTTLPVRRRRNAQDAEDMLIDSLAVKLARQLGRWPDDTCLVLLVTGGAKGSGASTVATGLGRASLELGRRTLVIDADLRKTRVARGGAEEPRPARGAERQAEVVPSPHGFDMLKVSGPRSRSNMRSTVLGVPDLLADVRPHYDVIVVDSAPVTEERLTGIIGQVCDAIVLVARARRTRLRDVAGAEQQLRSSGATYLGVVLNGVPAGQMSRPPAMRPHGASSNGSSANATGQYAAYTGSPRQHAWSAPPPARRPD